MNQKILITFGGGGQNYIEAGNRLINQAKDSKLFDKVILYTDEHLKKDTVFWDRHSEFIKNNKKGYGYWLWKPYLIKKTMSELKEGDILMYLDAGCEIGGKKLQNISDYFKYVKKEKIIGTYTQQIEKYWCKMDLLKHLDMDKNETINTGQRQAGVVLYYICPDIINFINLWYNTSCNYHMIDDSPSILPNSKGFREHRHDQSIFSLLTKKYKIYSDKSLGRCIYINRNRSGKSLIK